MSQSIVEGQAAVIRILREVADEQGIEINSRYIRWWTKAGEDVPSLYNLEVRTVSGKMEETDFKPVHLTELESDNQMKVQVYQKIAGIIGKLKKYEREANQ